MDLSNIISATERLLYQLVVWLVLLPKTLFRVIVTPTWISDYVVRELAKPDESRFDDYVAPLLFFVTLTVVPNLVANAYWPQFPYSDFATSRKIVGQAQTLSAEHRFFLYTLIWTLLPLSFAIVHLLAQKKELSSSQLKPLLYGQCLRVAPLGPLFALRFIAEKALGSHAAHLGILNSGTILLALTWLLYSDIRISVHALKVTPARAVVLALVSVVVYYVLISPVVLLSLFLR
jgi:hypothetical protein